MAVQWAGNPVPPEQWAAIRDAVDANGGPSKIPYALAVAIAHYESGFNCSARAGARAFPGTPGYDETGLESSYGLFQLNTSGVGSGYSVAELTDCRKNASIAMGKIRRELDIGKPLPLAIDAWSVAPVAFAHFLLVPNVQLDEEDLSPGAPEPPEDWDLTKPKPKDCGPLGLACIADNAAVFVARGGIVLLGFVFVLAGIKSLGNGR